MSGVAQASAGSRVGRGREGTLERGRREAAHYRPAVFGAASVGLRQGINVLFYTLPMYCLFYFPVAKLLCDTKPS